MSKISLNLRLSVLQYMKYLEGNENSRCIYEGEEVLHAGHIILCGQIKTDNPHLISLYALCLQSSAVNSDPHEVKGVLEADGHNNHVNISSMVCTCKAGQGGRCKHVSAVLLWCTSRCSY